MVMATPLLSFTSFSFSSSSSSSSSSSFIQPLSPPLLRLPSLTHHLKRGVKTLRNAKKPPLTNKLRASLHHVCRYDKEEGTIGVEEKPLHSVVAKNGRFADILGSILQTYCVEDEDEDLDNLLEIVLSLHDRGRLVEDYGRRANIFERIRLVVEAEMRRKEEMQKLEEVVMEEDNGRTPLDYRTRANIFTLSAQVFTTKGS